MKRLLCFSILILSQVAAAQGGGAPAFEVASVKPSKPGAPAVILRFDPGGRVVVSYMTLENLITLTYGIRGYQLRGAPRWVSTSRFDIVAAAPRSARAASQAEQMARLRTLLAERFQLEVHRETTQQQGLALVTAKGGVKLREWKQDAGCPAGTDPDAIMPMTGLATSLSLEVGQPVFDQTGLAGRYCVLLRWTSDDGRPQALGRHYLQGRAGLDVSEAPSLFTALEQQAGLKLESRKAPLDLLVIGRVAQPTPN